MKRLEHKVAIITGATGGIGSASAERFIDEGAKVAIAARSMDRAKALADRLGENALPVYYDLGDNASIEAAISATVDHFGRLDILFNNAVASDREIHAQDTTVTDIPLETWDRVMALNVRAALVGCQFALPHMLKTGGGSVINNASGSGLAGDNVRVAYGASKGALITLTKYIATQYGSQGIRCNAIAPGLIMIDKMKDNEVFAGMMARHVLTQRLGLPEDIAALAAFLAAGESGYITGQVICCDGGLYAHQPQYAEMMDMAAKR